MCVLFSVLFTEKGTAEKRKRGQSLLLTHYLSAIQDSLSDKGDKGDRAFY